MSSVAIIGAGSWGTALASVVAHNVAEVKVWSNEEWHIQELQADKTVNKRFLPGIILPANINFTDNLKSAVANTSVVVVAVPSHALQAVSELLAELLPDNAVVVLATKGLDPATGKFLHQILQEKISSTNPIVALSGPSFAREVAQGKFTEVCIASDSQESLVLVQQLFSTDYFKLHINHDIKGVELSGALKNIVAFMVGISEGLKLGANTAAAIITRGFKEMQALGAALGVAETTMCSFAGIGDLVLTATDNQSRNRRLGIALAQGKTLKMASDEIAQEIECVNVIANVQKLVEEHAVDSAIFTHSYQILQQQANATDLATWLKTLDS